MLHPCIASSEDQKKEEETDNQPISWQCFREKTEIKLAHPMSKIFLNQKYAKLYSRVLYYILFDIANISTKVLALSCTT